MKTPNIGLSEQNIKGISKILNSLLADEFGLYLKTRNYHWNVVGIRFHDLHKLFEAQYEQLDEVVDNVAERARAVGGSVVANLAEYAKNLRIKEATSSNLDAKTMIADLLESHETIIRVLREDQDTCQNKFGDAGTADFLTGLMEEHEKTAWMLRAMTEA